MSVRACFGLAFSAFYQIEGCLLRQIDPACKHAHAHAQSVNANQSIIAKAKQINIEDWHFLTRFPPNKNQEQQSGSPKKRDNQRIRPAQNAKKHKATPKATNKTKWAQEKHFKKNEKMQLKIQNPKPCTFLFHVFGFVDVLCSDKNER